MSDFEYNYKNEKKNSRATATAQLTRKQQKELAKSIKGTHTALRNQNQKVKAWKKGKKVKAQLRVHYIKEKLKMQKDENDIRAKIDKLDQEKLEIEYRINSFFGKKMNRNMRREEKELKYRIEEIVEEIDSLVC